MIPMTQTREVIEAPLSGEELAVRYRALCDDPCYANVPGKLELDVWGRMVMTPASFYHGVVQGRLCRCLATLGGEAAVDTPVVTPTGLYVADVAWASDQFMATHRGETPLIRAPEICIEVVSPSSSVKELHEKTEAYLAAGAEEVWIVYPQSKRCEFHGKQGLIARSRFAVDLADVFS
jgi:Uma2 family endonuclease